MTRQTNISAPVSKPDSIRFPPELREWLQAEAAANHRSFSGEVVHRVAMTRGFQLGDKSQKGNS